MHIGLENRAKKKASQTAEAASIKEQLNRFRSFYPERALSIDAEADIDNDLVAAKAMAVATTRFGRAPDHINRAGLSAHDPRCTPNTWARGFVAGTTRLYAVEVETKTFFPSIVLERHANHSTQWSRP